MARSDEPKWKRIVASVKAGTKGGNAGQWSARKAQLATQRYKKSGGSYSGPKTEAQKSLSKWTKEDWGTKSGKPSTQGAKATGERYLPKKARQALTSSEYAAGSVNPTRQNVLQYISGTVKNGAEVPTFGVCGFGTWTLL